MLPDWQLPPGVDRGLWDYLHASDMVASYDEQMLASPLAEVDTAFCDRHFLKPGRLIDLGCGTGRLCLHFAARSYDCVGVDLSDEMLATARKCGPNVKWLKLNLVDLSENGIPAVSPVPPLGWNPALPEGSFDYAACLFSTLGMIRGAENRARVIANAHRLLRPRGRLIVHAHNRFFRGLGWKRVFGQRVKTALGHGNAGDITSPQAYPGAPLTLHHFTRREILALVETAEFTIRDLMAVGSDGKPARGASVYGWLLMAERS
jgi:SAM-dependent methyltransferase